MNRWLSKKQCIEMLKHLEEHDKSFITQFLCASSIYHLKGGKNE